MVKIFLGILLISMLMIAGCMNTTSNTQKLITPQVTVEPPVLSTKSGLDVIVVPNPTQIQENTTSLVNPSTTLVYGIYSSNGGYVTLINSSNISSIVTVVTTEVPVITSIPTPIPTTSTIPTQIITPIITPTIQPTILPINGDLSDMQLLPRNNIFNTPIDNMTVDSHSNTWITSTFIGELRYYKDQPYNVVDNSVVPQYLKHIDLMGVSDNIPYPIPENAKLHPNDYDQVLQIYNPDTDIYYDLYHAVKSSDGLWSASVANYYDMSSNDLRLNINRPPEGEMQVKYDEVKSGSINHAIQASVSHTNDSYVWAYFHSNGEPYTDGRYPPVGQRFRLKSSVDISKLSPQARIIAQALKTYGLIVTDQHGSEMHVQINGNDDPRWDDFDLNSLSSINLKDFEAIDTSSLMIRQNSMQVKSVSVTPTPTKTPIVTLTPLPTSTVVPTINPGETFGAEASNPTGSSIGGGIGYNKMVLKSSAKYVVSTKQELLDAFKVAKPGEIVFVNGDAVIDMTGTNSNVIPAGIILASDRGQSGSQGGLIKRYRTSGIQWSQIPCFVINDNNVRITGLRFDGGETTVDQLTDQLNPPIQPLAMIAARQVYGLEVDNNEFYGFSYVAIELDNSDYWNKRSTTGDAWVHHNYIHHCQARGYGYGICLVDGHVLCEANIFDYMRHAICAEGYPSESYEYRYNHHLGHGYPIGASVCDVHAYPPGDYEDENSIAGYQYKIHHNTFDRPERPDLSDNYAIGIRAHTKNGVYIDHNIFNYNSASGLPVFLRACDINNVMFMSRNLIGYDGKAPTLVIGEAIMYNVTMPDSCG
jgi:hypothetical protein